MNQRRVCRHALLCRLVLAAVLMAVGGLSGIRSVPLGTAHAAALPGINVLVGYADDLRPNPNLPVPWQGSPNTQFIGGKTTYYDAGAIMLQNTLLSAITVNDVTVNVHGTTWDLWGSFTIPAGASTILTQTSDNNFDTSDIPVTCVQTNPPAPTVTITLAGSPAVTLTDSAHVLDTGGVDPGACPDLNESEDWRAIGTVGPPGNASATLTLAPAAQVVSIGSQATVTATLIDPANAPIANALVNFQVTGGPNAGLTGSGTTNSAGQAIFTYSGTAAGSDTVQASVPNASGGSLLSTDTVAVNWTTRGAVVFLIPGIQSHSSDGYFDTFWPMLSGNLAGTGLSGANHFVYGYNNASIQSGDLVANTYGCEDTYRHSIAEDVTTLNDEITAYLTLHPNTDVYLVGHSQGGLIAFSYLAYLRSHPAFSQPWMLPFGGQLKGVVTLDSPVGGIPSPVGRALTTSVLLAECPAMLLYGGVFGFADFFNMGSIAATVPYGALPRGGAASVAQALGYTQSYLSNQALATEATQHGIDVLTVGNTRDFIYAPCPALPGVSDLNISTQWLQDTSTTPVGAFGRAVALGTTTCDTVNPQVNHMQVLSESQKAIPGVAHFLAGNGPAPLLLPVSDLLVQVTYSGSLRTDRNVGLFTIQLANKGGSPASGVLLKGVVTGGGSVIVTSPGLSCTLPVAGQFNCSGQIDVYQTRTLQVVVSPRTESGNPMVGTVTVTATANPTWAITELDPDNNEASASGLD